MKGLLWGLIVVSMVSVLVQFIFGIAGALFHLLLVAAAWVLVYNPIGVGALRRA